MAVAPQTKFSL